jgi:hypothetical protein
VVSVYTVQGHLRNIFAKTGVRTRRDLVTKIFLPITSHVSATTSIARPPIGNCAAGRLLAPRRKGQRAKGRSFSDRTDGNSTNRHTAANPSDPGVDAEIASMLHSGIDPLILVA